MNRLRYRPKMALIGALFLAPLSLVTYFFTNEIHDKIEQIQEERMGVDYERVCQSLLREIVNRQGVQLLQGPKRAATGDDDLARNLRELDALNARYGSGLGLTARSLEVHSTVRRLLDERGKPGPEEAIAADGAAIRSIIQLNRDLGDNSMLVLDNHRDSFHLINLVVNDAPEALSSASEAQVLLVEGLRANHGASTQPELAFVEDRATEVAKRVEDDLGRVDLSLTKPRFSNDAETMNRRLDELVNALQGGYLKQGPSAQEAVEASSSFVSIVDHISGLALENLDSILRDRGDVLLRRRASVFAVDILFLSLALYAFAGFYHSTNRTVRSLVSAGESVRAHCEAVRSLASNLDLPEPKVQTDPIVIDTEDELRELGLMMVQLIEDLSTSVGDYSRSQRGMLMAKEEAERANLAKSEFLSRMSHELRTPLNSIMGFAQVLEMQGLPEGQLESTQLILRSAKHLLSMINEILDLARIETGELSLSMEAVPIGSIIREAAAMVGPLAEGRRVQLGVDPLVPDELCMKSDRRRLLQVCLNLLSNAVKYNVIDGSVKVSVTETGDQVRVEIADTGFGIDEDKLADLYSPFSRLGREGSEVEGTGLGLALSKGLIETMGGQLEYRPNEPQGSVFWFELPSAPFPVALRTDQGPAAALESIHWTRTKRILLIEDNVANVELMKRIFEYRPDAKLLVAMKGCLGLDLARQNPPDLVILDLNLPDLPGAEVLSALRADRSTSGVPVVVVSADATQHQTERLKRDGIVAYLTKPVDVRMFLQLIDQVFEEEPLAI